MKPKYIVTTIIVDPQHRKYGSLFTHETDRAFRSASKAFKYCRHMNDVHQRLCDPPLYNYIIRRLNV